jgi:xanthine dehydrogenase YagS FAD-binding subunit
VRAFRYERVSALDEALERATQPESMFYAGGTTLIDLIKLNVLAPAALIDINHLPLHEIDAGDDALQLGATSRMSDVARHEAVRAACPALAEALEAGASPQLRNMATLGGNVLQRTRCAYFRDSATPCNKREPGSGCGALAGVNEDHAVLGTSDHCIAVHPSDFAVPLVAFDAILHVRTRSSTRTIAAADFFSLPGETPQRENVLEPGQLITSIELPRSPVAACSTYVKVRDRSSYAFALASCAAGVERAADGSIAEARIALGGVGTVPWRARESEDLLRGKQPTPDVLARAAEAAFVQAKPTVQNAYKIELGIAAIVRALETVLA